MTRTVHVGRVSREERRWYEAVLEAQLAGIAAVAPGKTAGEVDQAARQVLRRAELDRYFTHSTGHGVGLEIHEPPRLGKGQTERLEPGMVITIEPGIYVPGKGGIRIEDMVVVTEQRMPGADPGDQGTDRDLGHWPHEQSAERKPMNQKEIKELIEFLVEKDIAEFELERGDMKLHIKRGGASQPAPVVQVAPAVAPMPAVPVPVTPVAASAPAAAPADTSAAAAQRQLPPPQPTADLLIVKSPIVGTFYEAPSPGAPPFVKIGDTVKEGQVLCIIEAMKLMNEIEAEVSGVIAKDVRPQRKSGRVRDAAVRHPQTIAGMTHSGHCKSLFHV